MFNLVPYLGTDTKGGFGVGDNFRDVDTIHGVLKGAVGAASFSCNGLQNSYMTKTWLLMMLTASSDLKAFYLPDSDSQIFANLMNPSTKQPYMVRGKTEAVEAEFDPVKNGNKLEVRNGQQFSIRDINLGFEAGELFKVLTVVMKVKITALPSSGQTEPLITLHSKKTFTLTVSSTGALTLSNGASNNFATGYTVTVGSFHYIQVSIARFDISNYDSAWMVSLDKRGTETGGTMTCKYHTVL